MSRRQIVLLGVSLLAGLLAATPLVQAAPRNVVFDPAATDGAPSFTLADHRPDGCRVTVTVGSLQVEDIDIAGQSWQILALPGGESTGKPGEPDLPTCGGLIAVPAGCDVSVTATVRLRETLAGLRPLPVQAEDAAEFQWDRAAYAGGGEPAPDGDPGRARHRGRCARGAVPGPSRPVRRGPRRGVRRHRHWTWTSPSRRTARRRSPRARSASRSRACWPAA